MARAVPCLRLRRAPIDRRRAGLRAREHAGDGGCPDRRPPAGHRAGSCSGCPSRRWRASRHRWAAARACAPAPAATSHVRPSSPGRIGLLLLDLEVRLAAVDCRLRRAGAPPSAAGLAAFSRSQLLPFQYSFRSSSRISILASLRKLAIDLLHLLAQKQIADRALHLVEGLGAAGLAVLEPDDVPAEIGLHRLGCLALLRARRRPSRIPPPFRPR